MDKQKIKDVLNGVLNDPRTWGMGFFVYVVCYVFMSAVMYYFMLEANDYGNVTANIELNVTAIQNGTCALQENTYVIDAWVFPLLFLKPAIIGMLFGYLIGENKK